MPQLVKGGKWVFGWSVVGDECNIRIPEEARIEYGFQPGEKVIIMSGSHTSGGFIISRKSVLSETRLYDVLAANPDLTSFRTREGQPVTSGKRKLCWTTVLKAGQIFLPAATLKEYGVQPGDRLLAGRGSYAGLAMLLKGPIIAEALKHPELEVFQPE